MDLKLSLPQHAPVPQIIIETRPKQVQEWLRALPLANAPEAARKLTDALAVLHSAKLTEDARLKLLEMYRISTRLLLPALHQLYADKPLPLAEKNKQAAALTRGLLNELAHGYKLVLVEQANRRLSFSAPKLAPLAIGRAIECLGGILDVCYEIYGPTPAGVWSELHQLYWHAAQHNMHLTPFAEGDPSTVDTIYKSVLLLTLADPYRLQQGQLGEVHTYLARFGQHAQLQALGKAENTHGLFLVRLDSDRPPKALSHFNGVTDARTDIILNTVPLARILHQHVHELAAQVSPVSMGLPEAAHQPAYREMLKRLIQQWGIAPKRTFGRTAVTNHAYICGGISALHYALSQGEVDPQELATDDQQITLQVTDSQQASAFQTYNCASWQVINESAGGVALAKEPGSHAKLKVGDLIGVGLGQGGGWGVAIVRWMQSETPAHLELGAQMLAPQAEAIAIKPVISAADALFQPALHLPEVRALQQAARIVAPRGSFQGLREFIIRSPEGMRTVRATQLLEQTDSMDLFFFSETGERRQVR